MAKLSHKYFYVFENGRGERIRTSDLRYPKPPRYQAAPRPDSCRIIYNEDSAKESEKSVTGPDNALARDCWVPHNGFLGDI